ncbi:MAG: carboxypeptidase-like regulatory domain-containing protein, partial [Bacteroidales bacterium]|nr:carboxypeptidase-like regulatory domain-containing protein [Bacteroidales bacterium]
MKKLLLYLVFFVLGASALLAQTRVITGTVTSSIEGEGTLPAVTVIVKGSAIGTSTDADGRYSLSV